MNSRAAAPSHGVSDGVDVTVVIPTHNRPQLVSRALASALAQAGVRVEVLVIDDGSDQPVSFDGQLPEVRVLRNRTAQGVAAARNRGIAEARGRWTAFLDDDDLWHPEKLRKQLEEMAAADARWSHVGVRCLDEALAERWSSIPTRGHVGADLLREANVIGTPSGVLVETELVRSVGGFDTMYPHLADWDLWVRMTYVSPALAIPEVLLAYTTHRDSMHHGSLLDLWSDVRQMRRQHGAGSAAMWGWVAGSARDQHRRLTATAIYLAAGIRWRDPRSLGRAFATLVRGDRRPNRDLAPVADWISMWQFDAEPRPQTLGGAIQ